jgi:hypothetical protein
MALCGQLDGTVCQPIQLEVTVTGRLMPGHGGRGALSATQPRSMTEAGGGTRRGGPSEHEPWVHDAGAQSLVRQGRPQGQIRGPGLLVGRLVCLGPRRKRRTGTHSQAHIGKMYWHRQVGSKFKPVTFHGVVILLCTGDCTPYCHNLGSYLSAVAARERCEYTTAAQVWCSSCRRSCSQAPRRAAIWSRKAATPASLSWPIPPGSDAMSGGAYSAPYTGRAMKPLATGATVEYQSVSGTREVVVLVNSSSASNSLLDREDGTGGVAAQAKAARGNCVSGQGGRAGVATAAGARTGGGHAAAFY